MKKIYFIISIFLIITMLAGLLTGCGAQNGVQNSDEAFVGMTCYLYADTHVSNIRKTVLHAAENGPIKVETADSKGEPTTEMNNIQAFVTKGADYIMTDKYDGNVQAVLNICKENDIGLVLYNTDHPTDEQADSYDKIYFVSSDSPDSGTIQGEMVSEYWKEHPEADRNGNGKLDYVMLQGDLGFYDTEMRTKYSVDAVVENGIEVNEVMTVCCSFSRAKAQDQMASIIAAHSEDIEVVFANNDDMALGAIEALKAAGFFADENTYIPVVGVDATMVALDALKEGTLLGTAFNDPVAIGSIAYQCVCWMQEGKTPITQEMLDDAGFTKATIDDHKRIWISYSAITADNIDEVNEILGE